MKHARPPISTIVLAVAWLCAGALPASAQTKPAKPAPVLEITQKDGRLVYRTDERGNRVLDFSHCGYMGGGVPIPTVPVRVAVPAKGGDSTARIQAAIDHVASLEPDADGFRGAVLLRKGRHEVLGGLTIRASGVVLRGEGMGDGGTVLIAAGHDRRTLITVAGVDDRQVGEPIDVAADHVPVNATRLRLAGSHGLKPGDTVVIRRPCTAEWIKALGMETLGGERHGFSWKPGSRELLWDRTVTKVEGDTITIDAPITTALDKAFGGGTVAPYTWPGRITHVGVENLRCESTFDASNPKDENHAWVAVTLERARDSWVRQATFAHFAGGAVQAWESTSRLTVEDCKSLAPVSEIGGHRRHTFFTRGQQALFQRLYSEEGRHDFAVGFCAAGPNAFVQCEAIDALADSGPIDSWASGVLYDNVRIDGNALSLDDRRHRAAGSGWSAANSVLWQSSAAVIQNFSPPTARNYALGTWGQFSGDGHWQASNEFVSPDCLYYTQLAERVGERAHQLAQLMAVGGDASTSPSLAEAAALTEASRSPAPQLSRWIEDAPQRNPIAVDANGAKSIDDLLGARPSAGPATKPAKALALTNGWLTAGGELVVGGRQDVQWWRGGIRPDDVAQARPHVTRFVPGRTGLGFTDRLEEVAGSMRSAGDVVLDHNYGLWYDRRRDDHQRVRRMDGDAWPPFYEQPFARSGQGVAWDGLSKYDLTKPNPWYWGRLRGFVDLAGRDGLVLMHQHYFQHNVLEAGAHYADSPWRAANNVNDTGFPEPPPYAGDKRIFLAEQFYDVSHPRRRELHRTYIRQCLDAFAGQHNVMHLTSAEYTGPLHFVQFWLDTIAEWERETGKDALVGLSATKDVQDAILADSQRVGAVEVIDIRYWWYRQDGRAYAPEGGKNLAPRQHQRQMKSGGSSPEQVYRAVREYRTRFPGKAVVYSADAGRDAGWAQLFGGGSLPTFKVKLDPQLLVQIPNMRPLEAANSRDDQVKWTLADPGEAYLVYVPDGRQARVDLRDVKAEFTVRWIDAETGELVNGGSDTTSGGNIAMLSAPAGGFSVLWLSRRR